MEIPQLVQEIIDYYLNFAQWKARIKQLNEEYKGRFIFRSTHLREIRRGITYTWRCLNIDTIWWGDPRGMIYNPRTFISTNVGIAKLPPRYVFSNTKEQLKSLYF